MEKLLLYHLINGGISPNKIDLSWIANPLIFGIVRTTQKADKRGESLTESDLLAVLKATLGSSEYLKSEAILKSIKSIDTEVSVGEVISNLKTTHALTQVEGTVSEIAEAALGKDLQLLAQKTKELQKSVSGTVQRKRMKLGDNLPNNVFMLDSSLPTLNKVGAKLSALTLIAAGSGVGKSVFAVNQLLHQWKQGKSSVMFSLEMPAIMVELRVIANMTGIHIGKLFADIQEEDSRVPLTKEEAIAVQEARAQLASPDTPDIFIYDDVNRDSEISAIIEQHRAEDNCRLFVIDYLNLMAFSNSASDGNNWASKAQYVIELNRMCVALNIVILLPVQIDIEKNADGSLGMRTRGTVELLNSSSLALLLYKDPEVDSMMMLQVTKARNAPRVSVGLLAELEYQRFTDLGQI